MTPALEEIAMRLLEETQSSRVTIRVNNRHGQLFPCVAEAALPGVLSLLGRSVRGAATFDQLRREKRVLVQDDVLDTPPVVPDVLKFYGTRAQMLGPIVIDDEVQAIISVHENRGPRAWLDADRAALEAAQHDVRCILEQAN